MTYLYNNIQTWYRIIDMEKLMKNVNMVDPHVMTISYKYDITYYKHTRKLIKCK